MDGNDEVFRRYALYVGVRRHWYEPLSNYLDGGGPC